MGHWGSESDGGNLLTRVFLQLLYPEIKYGFQKNVSEISVWKGGHSKLWVTPVEADVVKIQLRSLQKAILQNILLRKTFLHWQLK